MVKVCFVTPLGERIAAEGASGASLLTLGQAAGLPLEGTCEGQMACSTCHVIVDAGDFAKLPEASEAEEDLLDLASHVTRYSRLACQILIPEGLDRLTVRIPGGVHNMRGR